MEDNSLCMLDHLRIHMVAADFGLAWVILYIKNPKAEQSIYELNIAYHHPN